MLKQWNDAQVKESFEKGKKVVTFFKSSKSSTIGRSELAKVQEDLYGNKLGMLKQECKTRWSSTQLWIIFDECPGKHSAVLCARENDGC